MNKNETDLIRAEYTRKSDEAKERQEYSIPDQKKEIQEYSSQLMLSIHFRFQDEKTAFKPHKRADFDEMVRLIKERKINAIICWKENRLCRNPEEGGILIQLLQDGFLQEIRCVSSNSIYTPDSDHLILQIQFGMANQFSRNLSRDVRRGLYRKAIDRKQYPFHALLGFEGFGEIRDRNIRPHLTEAPFIFRAFELAGSGVYSLSHIADILFEEGFRTRTGKKVGKSHLAQILQRPTYYGYFYINGELCEGNYEPIIPKPLFDLVQERLKDRSKPKSIKWQREFVRLIRCARCGCAVTTTIKRKFLKKKNEYTTFIYHHCTHRRGNCKEKPIKDNVLKEILLKRVDLISIDMEVWQLGLKLVKEKYKKEIERNKHQVQYHHLQIQQIRDQVSRLIEMRANQELSREEFLAEKKRLLEKLASFEGKAKDTNQSLKTWLELIEDFFNTAFQVREILEDGSPEQKQKVLAKIGENFLLSDKKLTFSFKKPYDILLNPKYRKSVLGGLDSNQNKQIQSLLSYR